MVQQVLYTTQTFNVADAAEGGPVTVATTFVPAVDGTVDGVQVYGESNPVGTHDAVLYEVTFDDTGADGSSGPGTGTLLKVYGLGTILASQWQTIMFDTPVPVTGGKAYRIGYRTSLGHYAAQGGGFNAAGIVNGDLSSPKTGDPAGGFAVIRNGTFIPNTTQYPNRTFNGNMYPIGPVFSAAGDEEHTSTGTAPATASARSTVTTSRSSTGTATATADARATDATSRISTGTAHASASASASTAPRKFSTGTAHATASAGSYTAGGAPGPWLVSRRRQGRIVSRTQVAR